MRQSYVNGKMRGKETWSPGVGAQLDTLRERLKREDLLMMDVKVVPRSRAAQLPEVLPGGVLKIKVTAAPERGKANEEVCELLASCLGVAKQSVRVVSGHTSQQKRIRVVR
ncbi:MAG: DUF167 domain-containing protein [Acidobacteriaceae bacterium]|nr:DUF167 domain-containing protein [Acidobacteriaceae bacterium]